MFNGIIEEIGKISSIKLEEGQTTFSVSAKEILNDKKIGQSIAINGACMTITELSESEFHFDASSESLRITNLKNLKVGDRVNLESALKFHAAIDGHLLQGHIDSTGKVESLKITNEHTILKIKFPKEIAKLLAFKGSIGVNGVSLTIADLQKQDFSIHLIPLTMELTTLGALKSGDIVNLETDLMARYMERLIQSKEKEAKYQFLHERGLI